MKSVLILLFCGVLAVTCSELNILSSPKSVEFVGATNLDDEAISEAFGASLGYSVKNTENNFEVYVKDPFDTARAVVTVIVDGAEQVNFKNAKSFNIQDGGISSFPESLHSKVSEHGQQAVNIDLSDASDSGLETPLGELKKGNLKDEVQFLKPKTDKYDEEFLDQIRYLRELAQLVRDTKDKPSALNIHVSLQMIPSERKAARAEALKLLADALEKLNSELKKEYDGKLVFAVLNVEAHSRAKRQVVEPPTENPYNLADLRSKDYPVVFNIIFWFTLIFIFALIAISLALSNVEDKDSIIYRMTGARGKKEN